MGVSTLGLEPFLRKLASADPTPGGGSAAALIGAMGAGLVRMVALLTSGSPKFAHVAGRAHEIAGGAQQLLDAFVGCIDEDAAAYDRVTAAYRLPKSSDAEKAARSAAIQQALKNASDPPMRVVELAHKTSELAAELVDFGNPSAISDAGCAALCTFAAARGAGLNVSINVKNLANKQVATAYAERLEAALAQIGLLTEVVLGKVQDSLRRTR